MRTRGIASWVAVCAVALCAGVSAAVALGAPPPPPPPPTSTTPPPTTTSTPPPTSTYTPPPSSSVAPPPTSKATTTHHKKHHKKHQPNGGQTTPASTPTTPAVTGLAIGATTVQHAGSNVPHVALVASIVAGGAILFSALVLAGLLAFARGRRGGPRGPEGGTITIR
jgi:hypothetical protein